MPDFENRDPNAPAFWSERFERSFTPWDQGGVPNALRSFVERSPRKYRTLIPGCGAGYEAAFLAEAGWDVCAIDFSASAVERARRMLGRWEACVLQADFFSFVPERPIELIYERAFLCALPPGRRAAIAARWAELLAPGALLAGFFYFDDTPAGPPFGILPDELEALLAPFFERIADAPAAGSIAVFAGKERWQVWRRLPLP